MSFAAACISGQLTFGLFEEFEQHLLYNMSIFSCDIFQPFFWKLTLAIFRSGKYFFDVPSKCSKSNRSDAKACKEMNSPTSFLEL